MLMRNIAYLLIGLLLTVQVDDFCPGGPGLSTDSPDDDEVYLSCQTKPSAEHWPSKDRIGPAESRCSTAGYSATTAKPGTWFDPSLAGHFGPPHLYVLMSLQL